MLHAIFLVDVKVGEVGHQVYLTIQKVEATSSHLKEENNTQAATMTCTTPKSSRFQRMRTAMRNRTERRMGAVSSKHHQTPNSPSSTCTPIKKYTADGLTEGVFFKPPSVASLVSSDSSVTTSSSSYSDCLETTEMYPPPGWKSTERKSFFANQPLIVFDPEKMDKQELERDPVIALGKILTHSMTLPPMDYYYSSNHIMVNDERIQRTTAPLARLRELDDWARYHAEQMAQSLVLFHSDPTILTSVLQRPFRRLGENVASGTTIREIHTNMMENPLCRSDKYNILHRCYTHMGMGTAKGDDGRLYLCQIFRG